MMDALTDTTSKTTIIYKAPHSLRLTTKVGLSRGSNLPLDGNTHPSRRYPGSPRSHGCVRSVAPEDQQ